MLNSLLQKCQEFRSVLFNDMTLIIDKTALINHDLLDVKYVFVSHACNYMCLNV